MSPGPSETMLGNSAVDLTVDIRALTPDELRAATALLAHGMRDNPLHVRVFGTDPERRGRRLIRFLDPLVAYVHAHGAVLGAYVKGELVGVLGMMEPGGCRPALMDALRLASMILASNPPDGALRILRWLATWARNDPAWPHWHIGPMTVDPATARHRTAFDDPLLPADGRARGHGLSGDRYKNKRGLLRNAWLCRHQARTRPWRAELVHEASAVAPEDRSVRCGPHQRNPTMTCCQPSAGSWLGDPENTW